ncbi:MAG: T9SS type A sorting domain-containing protein [Ignavibacteriales bacterium]|nr:T9SS type A sorting domain-containing protein [Ignavibacteriales bacterium]
MLNNILWNPGSSSEFSSTSNVTGSYNNIRGGLTGIGNINSDPMFMPSDSLYRLTKGSPCIGAGVISASVGGTTLNAPTVDYLGMVRPRPASSSPDLGAVEHDRSFPDPAGGVEELTIGLPTEFSLSQNFPNPFNPNTVIRYQIPSLSAVRLKIFDVLGREVATLVNEEQPAGVYQAEWDARVSSGVYFYRLEAIGKGVVMFVETKKMVLKR